jgi:hypothetical protein
VATAAIEAFLEGAARGVLVPQPAPKIPTVPKLRIFRRVTMRAIALSFVRHTPPLEIDHLLVDAEAALSRLR